MRYLVLKPAAARIRLRCRSTSTKTPLLESWGAQANATNPDLSGFRKRGGKLIMTYGWADPSCNP